MQLSNVEQRTKSKIFWRIVPFIFVLLLLCFLDNVNVSYATLTMSKDLHFTAAIFGLGSGLYFIGFLLPQIPITMWANSSSPKRWLGFMAVIWGAIAISTSFINSSSQFFILRFVLGLAEGGLFSVLVIYVSRWFDARQRATVISILIAACSTAEVIGGPISTQLLTLHLLNWEGWRWLFVMEGLPSVIIGSTTFFYLKDWPKDAKWLNVEEGKFIESKLDAEDRVKPKLNHSLRKIVFQRDVITLCAIYLLWLAAGYGLLFFLPTIINGLADFALTTVGYLVALIYGSGLVVLIMAGKLSDGKNEKRRHIVIPMLIGTVSLAASILVYPNVYLSIITLAVGAIGIGAGYGIFWSLPNIFLSGRAAAFAIGFIGTVGNIGGFLGPAIVGYLRSATGSFVISTIFLVSILSVTILLLLTLRKETISPLQDTDNSQRGGDTSF